MDKLAMRVAAQAGAASADQLRAAVLVIVEKAAAWRGQGGVGEPLGNELLVALAAPLGAPVEFGPYGSIVDRSEG